MRGGGVTQVVAFPGRAAMVRPIEIEPVLGAFAKSIEDASLEYLGSFSPHDPLYDAVLFEALDGPAHLSRMALDERDWRVMFEATFVTSGIVGLEATAKKRGVSIGICMMEMYADAYDPSEMNMVDPDTASIFIEALREELKSLSERIWKWNEICKKHKPRFNFHIPIHDLSDHIKSHIRSKAKIAPNGVIEMWDLVNDIASTDPIRLGPWELSFEFMEETESVWLRHLLRNVKLEGMTFILQETRDYHVSTLIEAVNVGDIIDRLVEASAESVVEWNRMLDGYAAI